jgi:hypothetical protein
MKKTTTVTLNADKVKVVLAGIAKKTIGDIK